MWATNDIFSLQIKLKTMSGMNISLRLTLRWYFKMTRKPRLNDNNDISFLLVTTYDISSVKYQT